ncbi:MAG: hypothetical protein JXX14_13900 [Deltaproteobacteria bacterium]|nr:hypothetical protein [Deltaproteobacteria bacterium]
MEKMSEGAGPKKNVRLKWMLLVVAVAATFVGIFFLASPRNGALPPMPEVKIDRTQMAFAVNRFKKRAGAVTVERWQQNLINAYKKLNIAEARFDDAKTIEFLHRIFVEKSEIPQTAQKERYLLLGDYLALKFEGQLQKVLTDVQRMGLERVTAERNHNYQELIALSGNFFKESVQIGLIRPDGQLRVAPYVPQILFRKRWRVLGELPFRYQFLEIESLADAAYQLRFGKPSAMEMRLRAIAQIRRLDPDFNHQIASALVYYEGQESNRAIDVLKRALVKTPDNFTMNQFLLFLSNDTRR